MAMTTEEMRRQVMAMTTEEMGRSHRQYNGNGSGYRRNGNGYGRGGYSNDHNYRPSGYNQHSNQDTGTIRIPSQYRPQNHQRNVHRQMQHRDHHQNQLGLNNQRPQRLYNRPRGGLKENSGRGRGRGNNKQHQRRQYQPK